MNIMFLDPWGYGLVPIVSIVVPCWGYLFRIRNIKLVKPKNGTTMETTGRVSMVFRPKSLNM